MCLSAFYAVKLLRMAIIFVLLAPFAFLKSCELETTEPIRWPPMSSLLSVPALNDLLLMGVPLIGAGLGLALVGLENGGPS